MKSVRRRILAIALAVAGVGAAAVSQTVAKAHRHMGGGQGLGLEPMVGFMTDYLDLTKPKKAQVTAIIAWENPNVLPWVKRVNQSQQQLQRLKTTKTFDEGKVRPAASQKAQIMTELTVKKAKIHSEIFNILTPEQKSKATQFSQRREERFQKRMQQIEQAPPAQP